MQLQLGEEKKKARHAVPASQNMPVVRVMQVVPAMQVRQTCASQASQASQASHASHAVTAGTETSPVQVRGVRRTPFLLAFPVADAPKNWLPFPRREWKQRAGTYPIRHFHTLNAKYASSKKRIGQKLNAIKLRANELKHEYSISLFGEIFGKCFRF